MKTIVIALPTYNEAQNIRETISRIQKVAAELLKQKSWNLQVLVIDDNSPDGTAKIVADIISSGSQPAPGAGQLPELGLITGQKQGLGAAYIRGITYILQNMNPDYIMEMDADLQHSPEDIPRFLEKAEQGYEFIIGSRYISGKDITEFGFLRKINSWTANFIARYLAGIYKVQDCTSGFRCISAKFLRDCNLNTIQSKGYSFQMSLLKRAYQSKIRITEIPIHFPDRQKGQSKLGLKDIFEFFTDAVKLRVRK
ncbi:MAG TPA: polyprenol monophosphomannose synthase [Candidatus Gracilibacteria bacterium]|nr:polyprenol monophosphomannose synthase [Candidatus Gracilibacteria bacterium]